MTHGAAQVYVPSFLNKSDKQFQTFTLDASLDAHFYNLHWNSSITCWSHFTWWISINGKATGIPGEELKQLVKNSIGIQHIRYADDPVPNNLFERSDPNSLSKHLSQYVVETSGKLYLPSTLHSLLCGLLCHMRGINHSCPNFLDCNDLRFKMLHNTLDLLFNKLYLACV